MADTQKFRELVLYLSEKSVNDRKFGATKLNKLLFYCDFLSYSEFGQAVTGVSYQKIEHGPAPRCLVNVRSEMIEAGELALQPVRLLSGKTQLRARNLRRPDLSIFKPEEIALIDSVLTSFKDLDSEQVSEYSHLHIGWKLADEKETIPYGTAHFSLEPLSPAEINKGNEIADAREAIRQSA